MAINPAFQTTPRPNWDIEALMKGLKRGDRPSLARAITLVESQHSQDAEVAGRLIQRLEGRGSGESFRLGITGNPGAGKSTLIEALGQQWISAGHRVAVLAIDPSSIQSHGSLLGDKTRMEVLSRAPEAFIRPSPTAGALGGVHAHVPEVIALCEYAGYNRIVVETVGVGQNETAVTESVDFTLLVALPGAGDEVQGLKRGVMEAADLIWVNKADGRQRPEAKQAAIQLRQALGLFHRMDQQHVDVLVGSALEANSLSGLWEALDRGMRWGWASDRTPQRRKAQRLAHLTCRIQAGLWSEAQAVGGEYLVALKQAVENGGKSPTEGALEFLRHLATKHR